MNFFIKALNEELYLTYNGVKKEVSLEEKRKDGQSWIMVKLTKEKYLIKPNDKPDLCLDIYDLDYPIPVAWPCGSGIGRNREWIIKGETILSDNGFLTVKNGQLIYQRDAYQWEIFEDLEDIMEIKVATRNILAYGQTINDWKNCLNELFSLDADVVGLQEVTRSAYKLLDSWRDKYLLVEPVFKQEHTTVLLVKKSLDPTLYKPVELPNSPSRHRHYSMTLFNLSGRKIAVATAHIESVFFDDWSTSIKCTQISAITEALKDLDPDSFIFMGDCNLTQGSELKHENMCIEKNKLIDTWKEVHGTTDDEYDPKFRKEDVTWDYDHNNKVPHKEYHRPDRIFYRNIVKDTLIPQKIERIVNNYSDHFGLYAVYSL